MVCQRSWSRTGRASATGEGQGPSVNAACNWQISAGGGVGRVELEALAGHVVVLGKGNKQAEDRRLGRRHLTIGDVKNKGGGGQGGAGGGQS